MAFDTQHFYQASALRYHFPVPPDRCNGDRCFEWLFASTTGTNRKVDTPALWEQQITRLQEAIKGRVRLIGDRKFPLYQGNRPFLFVAAENDEKRIWVRAGLVCKSVRLFHDACRTLCDPGQHFRTWRRNRRVSCADQTDQTSDPAYEPTPPAVLCGLVRRKTCRRMTSHCDEFNSTPRRVSAGKRGIP